MYEITFTLLCFSLFCSLQLSAQTATKKKDPSVKKVETAPKSKSPNVQIYENALKQVENAPTLSETFLEMAKNFMGHDAYLIRSGNDAVTDNSGRVQLQKMGREVLFIDLEIFDCQSFVENTLALTLTKRQKSPNYEAFREHIKQLRYRNGIVGYGNRHHYFTEGSYFGKP